MIHWNFTIMGSLYCFIREQHLLALLEEAAEKKKTNINLSHFEITVAPPLLFSLKNVTYLYLNNNQLKDISGISRLKKLIFLTLDYNILKGLPEEIKHLGHVLTYLNVSYNPLRTLLPEIGHLRCLTVLWLNHCQLSELPPELGNLITLDTFGARGNFIRSIPNEFCKLNYLRWLTLEGNLIEELPQDFNELDGLIHLNLNKNCFKVMPESIKYLLDLQYCFLADNNIKDISKAFLKEVRHIIKLDLRGNQGLHVTPEIKSFQNLVLDGNGLCFQLPGFATSILESTLESRTEEAIWEVESELFTDEEWETDDEDSNGNEEHDWEESLPSSELDSTEGEIGIRDSEMGMIIPEGIGNMITSISCFVANGC